MFRTFLLRIGVLLLMGWPMLLPAQPLPKRSDILRAMRLANDYFMAKWPDTGKEIVTNKTRPSNIWTRAVYYEGLMALYDIDKQKHYYDYAVDWGEKHRWGLRSGTETRNADDQCCGQTYLRLYAIDPKPERLRDIKTCIDNRVADTAHVNDWTWIDAIQMAMPIYAQLAQLYVNEPAVAARYLDKMHQLYQHTRNVEGGQGLLNPNDGLWWRDKDFVPPYQEPNGQDCYWSRGNGWVVAALVRVLALLPKNAPHRAEYEQDYKNLMRALLPVQRPDGFWNVSLHDPTHFGGKETSGTALFAYGMAWGINQGLLEAKTYRPRVIRAWNALTNEALHANGFLGFVQGTGKEPKDGQPVTYDTVPDFEDYGLGCFLLAGSEVYRMK